MIAFISFKIGRCLTKFFLFRFYPLTEQMRSLSFNGERLNSTYFPIHSQTTYRLLISP